MSESRFASWFAKKYTFIFVPDVTGQFLRFSVPKIIIKSAAGLALASVAGFSLFSYAVLQKNEDLKELKDLRGVAATQKLEIQQFGQKLKEMEAQLVRLEQFDKKLRVITALETNPQKETEFGLGGPNQDAMANFSTASKRYTESLLETLNTDIEHVKKQAERQEVSFFELDEFFKDQSSLLSHTPSIWPARGWVTSTFGYRRSPFTGLREMHEGLDVATQIGAPVIAPANGIVIREGYHRGYGNMVEIDHGYGVITRFGHNSKILVKLGQKVRRGDAVATVGSTGRSTGPHLHYEVVLNGVPVNPYRYILED